MREQKQLADHYNPLYHSTTSSLSCLARWMKLSLHAGHSYPWALRQSQAHVTDKGTRAGKAGVPKGVICLSGANQSLSERECEKGLSMALKSDRPEFQTTYPSSCVNLRNCLKQSEPVSLSLKW